MKRLFTLLLIIEIVFSACLNKPHIKKTVKSLHEPKHHFTPPTESKPITPNQKIYYEHLIKE